MSYRSSSPISGLFFPKIKNLLFGFQDSQVTFQGKSGTLEGGSLVKTKISEGEFTFLNALERSLFFKTEN